MDGLSVQYSNHNPIYLFFIDAPISRIIRIPLDDNLVGIDRADAMHQLLAEIVVVADNHTRLQGLAAVLLHDQRVALKKRRDHAASLAVADEAVRLHDQRAKAQRVMHRAVRSLDVFEGQLGDALDLPRAVIQLRHHGLDTLELRDAEVGAIDGVRQRPDLCNRALEVIPIHAETSDEEQDSDADCDDKVVAEELKNTLGELLRRG